jgi:hypothetical protein
VRFTGEIVGEGHAVRIVTRTEAHRARIEAAGAECWIGDPDRLGTLRGALEGVTVACWLLGGASGSEEQLRALHGARLRSFLGSAIDTTVRGFLYEAAGSSAAVRAAGSSLSAATLAEGSSVSAAPLPEESSVSAAALPEGSRVSAAVLAEGERIARELTSRNSIPLALLHADPDDLPRWLEQARAALAALLGQPECEVGRAIANHSP